MAHEADRDPGLTPVHQPVLLREAVEQLGARTDGVYVDATAGEGGHASALLEASAPCGRVLGIDWDPRTLDRVARRLAGYGDRFIPVHGNYTGMVALAEAGGVGLVDGVLLDLGFSSWQVETAGHGFSFQRDEPLDMRYNPAAGTPTAAHLVNALPERELVQLLFRYGEEPRARAIARAIAGRRPVHTTGELAGIVAGAIGSGGRRRLHPATRTFQALRIAVNDELANVELGIREAVRLLAPVGRLVVISYHSLEDRVVKATIAREAARCICPPAFPVCVCGHEPTLRIVNRRIIRPGSEEIQSNPRSRSARMRVAERR